MGTRITRDPIAVAGPMAVAALVLPSPNRNGVATEHRD
jgi:hypothetical protein